MKAEQVKRNHHKQPQFYLKGFATKCGCPNTPPEFVKPNESIWVYKKGEPFSENNPKCKGIGNVAFTKDFYAFEEEDGTKEYNKYEDLLEQKFEKPAEPVIRKIRNFEEIDEKEKIILSKYIASMITRGDWNRQNHISSLEKTVNEIKNVIPQEVYELHKECCFDKTVNDFKVEQIVGAEKHQAMIEDAKWLSSIIFKMNWSFLIAPKLMDFLTSDNPVYYVFSKNQEYCIFPISSKLCFYSFLTPHGRILDARKWKKQNDLFNEIDDKTVEIIRNYIIKIALKEIYYSQKAEWLVKFINNRNNN